jgi:hypothetical protein
MMKRRTFLQRMASILALLGISEAEWLSLGNRHYQALAQTSSRKLALLIGINQYLQPSLGGCLTDVELQKELLVYRFGFQPSDILSLTDDQASRDVIEKAFFDHLGKQAKPGDVVFFHFSGFGSRIQSANALISVDGNCLLEETLLLMLRSLPTERVTAILDTSYDLPGTLQPRGLTVRARRMPDDTSIASAELDLQKQLTSKITAIAPALVLSATSNANEFARELQLSGFSAGLFTYALTQYLWEMLPATTVQVSLAQVGNTMQQLGSNQKPMLNSQKNDALTTFNDNLLGNNIIGAEGTVTSVEEDSKTVQLWLGGIAPQILEYYSANSQFTLIDAKLPFGLREAVRVSTSPSFILRSRNGLNAKATVTNAQTNINPQVGQLVREVVRVLPRNINLHIALGRSLERIERVDATSAFANLTRISSVVAGEQPADYIFGKLSEAKPTSSASTLLSSPGSYGLFSLSGVLIPNTAGEPGEAAKVAVQRLAPKLTTLLAAKLWRITSNETSSLLDINVTLEVINGRNQQVVMQRKTASLRNDDNQKLSTSSIPIGSRMQIRVENKCGYTLYLMLLGLDSSKNAFALYSWQKASDTTTPPTPPALQNIVIEPNSTIALPQNIPGFEWILQGLSDLYETQLIFSTVPFTQTLAALNATKLTQAEQPRIMPLLNPCEVTLAILQDLHNNTHNTTVEKKETSDTYIWDNNNWASFSFAFQVV